MIIDMQLNEVGVIARISQSMDDYDVYAQEIFHRYSDDQQNQAFRSVLSRLSKKTNLCNVTRINLSTTYADTNSDEPTTLDILDSHIARSLDMPCVPIFTTLT